jgi:signal recognition particle subunit SRP54
LVSTDVYRPAAIEQLESISKRSGLDFYKSDSRDPITIAKSARSYSEKEKYDVVIYDTAGRLHIDDEMMQEAVSLRKLLNPHEVLYVADSMTGQDAVNSAAAFNNQVKLTGVILTKLDGDARGGAAFSIKAVTGVPIRFVGMGEKAADLELFHPERLVSRILGMGDVLSLIEKAEQSIDKKEAEELADKFLKDQFTLEDFHKQLQQIKKMGPLSQVLSMVPGMAKNPMFKNQDINDDALKQVEAIINSMTKQERINHFILNGSRKLRIAKGSGTNVAQVNTLLKQFVQTKKMMKQMRKVGFGGKSGIMHISNLT